MPNEPCREPPSGVVNHMPMRSKPKPITSSPNRAGSCRPKIIERVSGRKKAIKSVLLDQAILAGVGNLYADEVLFQAKVHPETRSDGLSNRTLGEMVEQVEVGGTHPVGPEKSIHGVLK